MRRQISSSTSTALSKQNELMFFLSSSSSSSRSSAMDAITISLVVLFKMKEYQEFTGRFVFIACFFRPCDTDIVIATKTILLQSHENLFPCPQAFTLVKIFYILNWPACWCRKLPIP